MQRFRKATRGCPPWLHWGVFGTKTMPLPGTLPALSAMSWPPNCGPAASIIPFTPVLDLDYGPSRVIGDRAFIAARTPSSSWRAPLIAGLRQAGMGNCGKHFRPRLRNPGFPCRAAGGRSSLEAMAEDLEPYRRLPWMGSAAAHVIYQCTDRNTAVFSNKWITFLRNDVKLTGSFSPMTCPWRCRRRRRNGPSSRDRLWRRLRHVAGVQCPGCRRGSTRKHGLLDRFRAVRAYRD